MDELWRVYILACEDYTARGLTYSSDTLSAISGLMARVAPSFGGYYAGLCERDLLLSLQWEACDTQSCHRHKDYVARSWLWASRMGAVVWYMECTSVGDDAPLPTPEMHDFATVVSVACEIAGQDVFGKVGGGHLTIKGYVVEMFVVSTELLAPDGRMAMRRLNMDGEDKDGVGECYVTSDKIED